MAGKRNKEAVMQVTDEMRKMKAAGMGTRAIAAKLGVGKTTVQKAFAKGGAGKVTPAGVKFNTVPGRTLSEFRSTYDKGTIIPAKVKAALKTLGSGWEYEVQFAKLAGVSLSDLGNFRDQFSDHVVTLRESRRAWAGTKATATAMKEML